MQAIDDIGFTPYLNTKIEEIHSHAKDAGWWENPRSSSSVYALFHTEISEAVEEERKPQFEHLQDRGIYHYISSSGEKLLISGYRSYDSENGVDLFRPKPEGTGVELVDMVIRVLDYLGHRGLKLPEKAQANAHDEFNDLSLYTEMHYMLSMAYVSLMNDDDPSEVENLAYACDLCCQIFEHAGWSFQRIFEYKLAFNKTRGHRHGGKKF